VKRGPQLALTTEAIVLRRKPPVSLVSAVGQPRTENQEPRTSLPQFDS